jgi:hypothetical protein
MFCYCSATVELRRLPGSLTDKLRNPGAVGENRCDRVNFVNFTRAYRQIRFDVNFVNFGPSAEMPRSAEPPLFDGPIIAKHRRHRRALRGWTAAAPFAAGSSTKQPKYRTRP